MKFINFAIHDGVTIEEKSIEVFDSGEHSHNYSTERKNDQEDEDNVDMRKKE